MLHYYYKGNKSFCTLPFALKVQLKPITRCLNLMFIIETATISVSTSGDLRMRQEDCDKGYTAPGEGVMVV